MFSMSSRRAAKQNDDEHLDPLLKNSPTSAKELLLTFSRFNKNDFPDSITV
jgi:hypothetical protein